MWTSRIFLHLQILWYVKFWSTKWSENFQEDTCKIHQNLAVSKYFDGSGRNPPEFLNKNGNTNVPMNPNEGIRFNSIQECSKRKNTKLRIWTEPKKLKLSHAQSKLIQKLISAKQEKNEHWLQLSTMMVFLVIIIKKVEQIQRKV